MPTPTELAALALVGCGATALMDGWLAALKRLGVPALDMALIGRWAGHLARGRVRHPAIAQAPAIAGERWLGWLLHYAVGIAFAGLLAGSQGLAWLHAPTLPPALLVGLCTVAFPFAVMQPAMGAGFAARRTATPWRNRLRSLGNHAVFGLGLYLSAAALAVFNT